MLYVFGNKLCSSNRQPNIIDKMMRSLGIAQLLIVDELGLPSAPRIAHGANGPENQMKQTLDRV